MRIGKQVEDADVLYGVHLKEKLDAAEQDVREGRVLSHDEVVIETAKWFSEVRGRAS